MNFRIEHINTKNKKDINKVDGTFTVHSILDIDKAINNNVLIFSKVTPFEKKYGKDKYVINEYITSEDKNIFFCYLNDRIVGQVIIRKNWNNYSYIEDITVDRHFRRIGIGSKLIEKVIQWTREKNLRGIMIETQNNNADACKFYYSYGFRLGGYDRFLYRGLNPNTNEIALYWYYLVE